MAEKSKRIKKKLVEKYRLVVLTDESFEEKFSFKLTRLNVFVFGGLFSVFLIFFTAGLIVYTPLKEYIPGFESPDLKKNAINLNIKLDSLVHNIHALELYTESMKPILLGDKAIELDVLPFVTKKGESVYQSGIVNSDSIHNKLEALYVLLDKKNNKIKALEDKYKGIAIENSKETDSEETDSIIAVELASLETSVLDSVFRQKVEREERFSISSDDNDESNQIFVSPVNGKISEGYSIVDHHLALDIATKKDTPVKSIADGTVIFSEWSIETGYVVVIMHKENYISVYKHSSRINVSQGVLVKAGQVIANVGSTGELSTGPHLHFEMWKDGYPVDPTNFMKF